MRYKIKEINVNFLLTGDRFVPEMHLRQQGFTYSACGPFTKNKERIQKFKETGESRYVYQSELDKACFQHDMIYRDFKDVVKITDSDKILHDEAFNIPKNCNYDRYQRRFVSMFYELFDKNTSDYATKLANKSAIKNENISNKKLA